MEQYIPITAINDFLYSPCSLYLGSVYHNSDFSSKVFHSVPQVFGNLKHTNIDEKKYSTEKKFLMNEYVYSEKYKLVGKIDVYDREKGRLVERKGVVKRVYTGMKYQVYAQYFCLKEMGETPKELFLHSLKDNKRYEIPIPNKEEIKEFEKVIESIHSFNPLENDITRNCDENAKNSIYGSLSW